MRQTKTGRRVRRLSLLEFCYCGGSKKWWNRSTNSIPKSIWAKSSKDIWLCLKRGVSPDVSDGSYNKNMPWKGGLFGMWWCHIGFVVQSMALSYLSSPLLLSLCYPLNEGSIQNWKLSTLPCRKWGRAWLEWGLASYLDLASPHYQDDNENIQNSYCMILHSLGLSLRHTITKCRVSLPVIFIAWQIPQSKRQKCVK